MFDIKNMPLLPKKYFHELRGYMIDSKGETTNRWSPDNLGAVIYYMAEPNGPELVGFCPAKKD